MPEKAWRMKNETAAGEDELRFDFAAAKKATDSFSFSTGVRCGIYTQDGRLAYEQDAGTGGCEFCRALIEKTGTDFQCATLHSYGAFQSERFGGRYIYFCPAGMAFFASPILIGGAFCGAFVGGPALILEIGDFLAGNAAQVASLPAEDMELLWKLLRRVPQMEPRRLEYLSEQLFANAVYIGDSSLDLLLAQRDHERQNLIGDYIANLKSNEKPFRYPIEKEQELFFAITDGDRESAGTLLNEILGTIYFPFGNHEEARARVAELMVVLSRAAICGGANVGQILRIGQEYRREMHALNTQEEMTHWLFKSLNRFMDLVFGLLNVKHSNSIRSAIDYMKSHYAEKITLQETAQQAGYAPSYFSRIFREETGKTFKEYLNEIRVEQSKKLLLAGKQSISEICTMTGFSDQSYFCKTFRRLTGSTPDNFRKRTRRIDVEREYGRNI